MADYVILIVEDERSIREMVRFAFERAGLRVMEAGDATQAQQMIADERPDLVLIDWMLPGTSGLELGRRLKADDATRDLPIIILTARGEEDDRVRGLEIGADDYVVKPFSPRELIARVKAVLRRAGGDGDGALLEADGLRLDATGYRVTAGGEPIRLGPTEFRLLQLFMSHMDRVFTRAQLLDRVWGQNVFIEERTVDVHIRRLRMALAEHGYEWMIQTVRGVGYRLSLQR